MNDCGKENYSFKLYKILMNHTVRYRPCVSQTFKQPLSVFLTWETSQKNFSQWAQVEKYIDKSKMWQNAVRLDKQIMTCMTHETQMSTENSTSEIPLVKKTSNDYTDQTEKPTAFSAFHSLFEAKPALITPLRCEMKGLFTRHSGTIITNHTNRSF